MSYQKLYHEELLEHYNHPANRGTLEKSDFSSGVFNPSCGDQVTIQGVIKDGVIDRCVFEGKGCVISIAAASLVTNFITGKTLDTVLNLTKDDMLALVKIELGPTRLRCALLALEAVHAGLHDFKNKKGA